MRSSPPRDPIRAVRLLVTLPAVVLASAALLMSACDSTRCSPPCEDGFLCIEDGRGSAVCADPETRCGGFANFACPEGYAGCIDDPRDSCDPANGGADCGGICVR